MEAWAGILQDLSMEADPDNLDDGQTEEDLIADLYETAIGGCQDVE